jgi:hypothetical protein
LAERGVIGIIEAAMKNVKKHFSRFSVDLTFASFSESLQTMEVGKQKQTG